MRGWVRRSFHAPMIGRFRQYSAAQAEARYLAEHGIPLERIAVLAEDMTAVEAPPGNVTAREAALHGWVAGIASAGLLVVAAHLNVVDGAFDVGTSAYAIAFGALAGLLGGVALPVLRRRLRRAPGEWNLHAHRYRLLADPDIASQAEQILRLRDRAREPVEAPVVAPTQGDSPTYAGRWPGPVTARDEAARTNPSFGRGPLG